MSKILIVEDDKEVKDALCSLLSYEGYDVRAVSSIKEYDTLDEVPDLYLLDVLLPDGTGYDICGRIRKSEKTPIIFITSCDDEDSIVKGLDIGGDDYITKPFRNKELLSRISANLRRTGALDNGTVYQKDDLKIYFDKYKVEKAGKPLNISKNEFDIIKLLVDNKGKVVKRDTFFEKIWDIHGNFVEYNTLTVTMSRLKAKLGVCRQEQKSYIETIRNVGYRWID